MKNKILWMLLVSTMILLSACDQQTDQTKAAVKEYNKVVSEYTEQTADYRSASQSVSEKNRELEDVLNEAQEVLNRGETPFDEETRNALTSVISTAAGAQVPVPDPLPDYEKMSVDDELSKKELQALQEKAEEETKVVQETVIPDLPEIPDYSEQLAAVREAQTCFENSVQAMRQITAPSDQFVMERLRRIGTITDVAAVTEAHDPNGNLKKQGGYIGCIYFADSQVDRSQLYSVTDDTIDTGTSGGGAIEIYSSAEDANARSAYLGAFDATALSSGSHNVYGTVIIRTSELLTGSQQTELTQNILNELTKVE